MCGREYPICVIGSMEMMDVGMYTVAALLCWLPLVMKNKFWSFACKYSHTAA